MILGGKITTYRAVARHRLDADNKQKHKELIAGYEQLVYELLEGGMDVDDLERLLESIAIDFESDMKYAYGE